MDTSVDPCDDFYKFACGNYRKEEKPSDVQALDNYYPIATATLNSLKFNIEKNVTEHDPNAFKLLKTFYNTCMDKGMN